MNKVAPFIQVQRPQRYAPPHLRPARGEDTRRNDILRGGLTFDEMAGGHLLSLRMLSRACLDDMFGWAETLEEQIAARSVDPLLKGYMMASLFFQPSTRTRFGFEAAMNRLGGTVLSCADVHQTRSGTEAQGWVTEPMSDMARVMSGMVDIAVMRHPTIGAVAEFARYAAVPVVNAGNGMGRGAEHPTQALIDLYTIQKEFGRIDGLKILVAGSLQFRVAHSLLSALGLYEDVTLYLLCPDEYWWTPEEDAGLRACGVTYTRIDHIRDVIGEIDVLYHNGLDELKFDVLPDGYTVDPAVLEDARNHLIVMHPLPRDIEVPHSIDGSRHARYFDQVRNGVPLRMAVLTALLGQTGWTPQGR